MIRFGAYSYILLFGFLNGAAVAAVLARTRTNGVANRVLAALLLVVVLRLIPYIIGYANFYEPYPWLSFAPFDLPLAIGPLLWLYVQCLTTGALPARWRWHLLPAAIHACATTIVFIGCTLPQKNWIALNVVDPFVAPVITIAALGALASYAWRSLTRVWAYQAWLDGHLSNREEFRLTWLRLLLIIFAGLGVVWLGFAFTNAVITRLNYFDEFPFYVLQAFVAWSLGLLAMRYASTVYPLPLPTDASPEQSPEQPPEPSGESRATTDWTAIGEQHLARIRESGWYRDPQLTLASLARQLGTNTTYLSRALNQGLGQSFNECINRLRVESVAADLRAGSTRDLVQLGFDAGFNSKASFQRAFSSYMHTTPSAYRASQQR